MDSTVTPLVDAGLGNSTYLVDLGEGRGLVVDASRDLRAVRRAAERAGLTVAYAAETHLHADFVSGARQLSSSDHATVLASASGQREFTHKGLEDGAEVDLGGLRLRALGTPGHTDEHLSYLLLDGDRPLGVFTGGSLLVGGAARTDLVDPARTEELARAQYRSIRRLTSLPDEVAVWPTHGAGSFCSAPATGRRTSTIGDEKAGNPLLQARDEDTFVAALLGSLGTFPLYFLRLAEINRRGPALLNDSPRLVPVSAHSVRALVTSGAQVVDVRGMEDFGGGHIPGSVSIVLRDVFATWLGWVADPRRPIVIVRDRSQDPEEIGWQAAKIGYDNVRTELEGGIEAWRAAGFPLSTAALARRGTSPGRVVVDVRQAAEFAGGHVRGALSAELGTIAASRSTLPPGPIALMCGHGERAMTAASLLERAGRTDVETVLGGPRDVASALDLTVQTGR